MIDFPEITYVVDAQDHLVSVNTEWSEFAVENDGQDLSPTEVIGRSLWDFIEDEPTRELYRNILAHVRAGGSTELVLRCDGPEQRRLIEMVVTRLPERMIQFKTALLASKDRPPQRLLDRSAPRSTEHVKVCSWCDRVNIDSNANAWSEVEEAMEHLHLTDAPKLPIVDRVVCPTCTAKVMEILRQEVSAQSS